MTKDKVTFDFERNGYVKQCKCKSTSSGPRSVGNKSKRIAKGVFEITYLFVQVACDDCDAIWKVVEISKEIN